MPLGDNRISSTIASLWLATVTTRHLRWCSYSQRRTFNQHSRSYRYPNRKYPMILFSKVNKQSL